jgi:hypothetical protein
MILSLNFLKQVRWWLGRNKLNFEGKLLYAKEIVAQAKYVLGAEISDTLQKHSDQLLHIEANNLTTN